VTRGQATSGRLVVAAILVLPILMAAYVVALRASIE